LHCGIGLSQILSAGHYIDFHAFSLVEFVSTP
jgi:hypothetical protein